MSTTYPRFMVRIEGFAETIFDLVADMPNYGRWLRYVEGGLLLGDREATAKAKYRGLSTAAAKAPPSVEMTHFWGV